jgi:hypothetical protein
MKKYIVLILVSLTTLASYAQNCGFDSDTSTKESNKKMEWFVKKLMKQKLVITNEKNDIPIPVLKQLNCYTNGFDIANPDEKHQNGCGSDDDIPAFHLRLLAKNKDYLVISYNTYNLGISSHHIWIKYNKNGITDFWSASTGGGLVVDSKFDIYNYYKQLPTWINY